MDGLAVKVKTTDGVEASYRLTPRIIVAFEQNYNGPATIRRKTELALQLAGGIMIWELSQDARGSDSPSTSARNTCMPIF